MKKKPIMKKKGLTLLQRRMLFGYLFISPWLIGFLVFYVRSIIMTVQFSFSRLNVGAVGGYTLDFVGLDNYIYAFFEHGSFKQVLSDSLGLMLMDIPLIIFFSLFMAIILNRKFRGRTIVRAIFFFPVILSSGAIAEALQRSLEMVAGGISAGTSELAAESTSVSIGYYIDLFRYLSIPGFLLDYIVEAVERISEVITASGVQIVIFLAALQSIPSSMYEVAKIEGATDYETFWKVTFPMVMPHIITNTVYTIIDAFAESEVITLSYDTAFTYLNYGLSSTFSLISTIITCAILVLICRFIQKRTFYYN